MAFSIEQILGFTPLTAAVEKVKAGIPRVLPEPFYRRPPADQVLGDKAANIAYSGTRKVARVVPYGAPPRQIVQSPRESVPVALLHTIENLPFKQELFLQLRELESYTVQRMAATEIKWQAEQAAYRQTNLETAAVQMLLANGKLWFDVDGNLLPTSSGADLTIDMGVPATNQNQIDSIIDASWATATTKIVLHLKKIQRKAIQETGYALKYAIYGRNIPTYLARNTEFLEFAKFNQGYNAEYVSTGEIKDGTAGFTWVNGSNAFFEDPDGTKQQIVGDDQVLFTPEVSDNRVWTVHEGSYPVPKSLMMAQDVNQLLSNYEPKYGQFGFAMMNPPSQIIGVYGDTFLPRMKVPAAFYQADVTP